MNINMLTLTFKPTNREQKRKVIHERAKIVERLLEIEFVMYDRIFQDNGFDYKEDYCDLLEYFKGTVDWINRVQKPKYHTINEHYFEQIFKPLEQ